MARKVKGLRELFERQKKLSARARDMRPLVREFRRELRQMIGESWAERQSPMGEAWAPLSPRSRRSETNSLRRAHQLRGGKAQIKIRIQVWYAQWQFFGRRGMPGRNPLPFVKEGSKLVFAGTGKAGEWWDRSLVRLRAYLSGEDGVR